MKPSKKEIRVYFKNVEKVKCLFDGKTELLDLNKLNFWSNEYWIGSNCKLWSPKNGYAEIISYKEEILQIPKSVLLQLAENNSFSEEIIKKEFPQLFESELEVGKWYKCEGYLMVWNNGNNTYGFHRNDFSKNWVFGKDKSHLLTPATEQEVFEALTNEAVKRGYKVGNFKCLLDNQIWGYDSCQGYFLDDDGFHLDAGCVFKDGVWASIIDQPKEITISEIEKILGYKILIKE